HHRPKKKRTVVREQALRQTPEGRNWDDYAARTARYAFGPAGDRQAASLEKYRDSRKQLGAKLGRLRGADGKVRLWPGGEPAGREPGEVPRLLEAARGPQAGEGEAQTAGARALVR